MSFVFTKRKVNIQKKRAWKYHIPTDSFQLCFDFVTPDCLIWGKNCNVSLSIQWYSTAGSWDGSQGTDRSPCAGTWPWMSSRLADITKLGFLLDFLNFSVAKLGVIGSPSLLLRAWGPHVGLSGGLCSACVGVNQFDFPQDTPNALQWLLITKTDLLFPPTLPQFFSFQTQSPLGAERCCLFLASPLPWQTGREENMRTNYLKKQKNVMLPFPIPQASNPFPSPCHSQ